MVRGSVGIAFLIAVAIAGWILSGQVDWRNEPDQAPSAAVSPPLPGVRVRVSSAQPHTRTVEISGETRASRVVRLRSRVEAPVGRVVARQGLPAALGSPILHFRPEDLPARIAAAEALVRQRDLEHEAGLKLERQGHRARLRIATAHSALEAARAALERLRSTQARMVVRMPFDGVVNDIYAETGSFLKVGDQVAQVVDLDPLVLSGSVAQQDRRFLAVGQTGSARLLDGTTVSGRISYVSVMADRTTRTFRVDMEIPNPDGVLVQGLAATLVLGLEEMPAHRVSGDVFTLGPSGRLGVKTVDDGDIVRFRPITVVGGTDSESFVTGLAPSVRLIVVGQEFVQPGDRVRPVDEAEPRP